MNPALPSVREPAGSMPLAYAHGGPPLSGRMRVMTEDFEVEEQLGFEPEGAGEHAWLWIEKRNTNSEWVAGALARFAGVVPVAVGFSGLKDRHALTRQWYSIHLPGRSDPDWSVLDIEGVRLLDARRHARKLKRGVHRGNRFHIRLREVEGDCDAATARLQVVASRGVPNYFGEQRFGHGGGNLDLARRLFAGARLGRSQRGFALSAARSHLFNAVLDRRVRQGQWDQAMDGEVWMLAGSHALFGPEPFTPTLQQRLETFDIDPTGPLWGRGSLRSTGSVAELEGGCANDHAVLADGLAAQDLRHERRSLRLRAEDLAWSFGPDRTLALEFSLPAGAFATAVIREVCAIR